MKASRGTGSLETKTIISLKPPIMKAFHCSDAGFDCKKAIRANTDEEILTQASVHVKTVHGVEVTRELAGYLKKLIKVDVNDKEIEPS